MKRQYELELIVIEDGKVVQIDKTKGDSLTELLSRFLLVIHTVTEKFTKISVEKGEDDVIPF